MISVIIPCFNQGKWLNDAIKSINNSTYKDIEIIVVNDGSTDLLTLEVLSDLTHFVGTLEVKVIHQENSGLSSARNAGVRAASGSFVQFLDADDTILPTKLALQRAAYTKIPHAQVVICDYYFEDINSGIVSQKKEPPIADFPLKMEDFLLSWERGLSIPIHCALFRLDIVKETPFEITVRAKEDWIFWVSLAAKKTNFITIPDALVAYRQHDSNMCRNSKEMGIQFLLAANFIAKKFDVPIHFFQQSLEHYFAAYYQQTVREDFLKSKSLKPLRYRMADAIHRVLGMFGIMRIIVSVTRKR